MHSYIVLKFRKIIDDHEIGSSNFEFKISDKIIIIQRCTVSTRYKRGGNRLVLPECNPNLAGDYLRSCKGDMELSHYGPCYLRSFRKYP